MEYRNGSSKSFNLNFLQTLQSEILFIIITTFSGIILARYLGPTGRGEYIAITMWGNLLVWYLNFNIYLTVIYYWKNLIDERLDLIKTLFTIGIFLGVLAMMAGEFVIIPLLLNQIDSQTLIAARVFFLSTVLGISCDVIYGILAAENKFFFANVTRILNPTLITVGLVILILIDNLSVAYALYILFIVNTIMQLIIYIYGYRQRYFQGRFNYKLIYTLWYGIKAQGGSIADATAGNASTMILSLMLPHASLGYFSTARSSIGPLSSVSKAIQKVSFPKLTGLSSMTIHDRTIKLWNKSLLLNVIIAIPFTMLLPLLIPLLYGKEFQNAIVPAIVLVLFSIIDGQTMIFRNAVNGSGKTFVNTTTEIISAFFIIITLLLTVNFWGVIGASIITVISALLKVSIYLYEYNKSIHKLTIRQLIPTISDLKFIVFSTNRMVKNVLGLMRVNLNKKGNKTI